MMDCKQHFFNYDKAWAAGWRPDDYKQWLLYWTIRRRSKPHIHTEWKFSQRYDGVSNSATLQDGSKCNRFKFISFTHPEYWDTLIVPLTDFEEDKAWKKACSMSDMALDWFIHWANNSRYRKLFTNDSIYGANPVPYDTVGQVCHVSSLNLWKPDPDKTWCSKSNAELLIAAKGDDVVEEITKYRAEMKPTQYFKLLSRLLLIWQGKCINCGCTESDCGQCVAVQGHPCHWVKPSKCSRCFDGNGHLKKGGE